MTRILAGALALLLVTPAAAQAPAAPPPAVVVAKAGLRDLTRHKEFVGRVKAVDSVNLVARVQGFLRERRFTEGQDVKPGDVLFVIEPDQYQADVESAKAEVAKAEATIKDTTAQLARARELIRNQNIAQSTVDQRAADDGRARAQLLANQAALKQAELNLGYTQIVAPIAGRIGQAAITPGNLVNQSTGTLATIVSQDPIYITFPVSARELVEAQRRAGGNVENKVLVRVRLADGSLYGTSELAGF
jgi:membrane fusion protein (multidrug efflux system)